MKPYMKSLYPIIIIIICCCANVQDKESDQNCEWCGATEAPPSTNSNAIIAGKNEKGQRIKISGTVYQSDMQTPASDVILYLYHTNTKGIYPKKGNETGNGVRHGYLRGWIKTDRDGSYSFETIRPKPYPGRAVPAHIHITVKESNKDEYWLKDYFFEDDNLLTEKDRKNSIEDDKFDHVISLSKQGQILIGNRDIKLKD